MKEQSALETFLVHPWMRLNSSQGGLLQQRDKLFPLQGTLTGMFEWSGPQ